MSDKKTFAVIGLGDFGREAAISLSRADHDVIAIDRRMDRVTEVETKLNNAVQCDAVELEQLRATGCGAADTALIAMSGSFEESIMTILNLKELGVPHIIAKAASNRQKEVFLKVGADEVIQPDKESARRTAVRLNSNSIVDMFDVGDKYTLAEIKAPKLWQNHTLAELNLRRRYNINIMAVRNPKDNSLEFTLSADYKINPEDILLLCAESKTLLKMKLEQ